MCLYRTFIFQVRYPFTTQVQAVADPEEQSKAYCMSKSFLTVFPFSRVNFLFLLSPPSQSSVFTVMVSGESKANVVEMPLHSVHLLYFVLQHMYAQVALCSLFCRKKMACNEVLHAVAGSGLRQVDSSVVWEGEGKRDK